MILGEFECSADQNALFFPHYRNVGQAEPKEAASGLSVFPNASVHQLSSDSVSGFPAKESATRCEPGTSLGRSENTCSHTA